MRLKAFEFLSKQTALHGETLPWSVLSDGFTFKGRRIPLTSQQGIFKPAVLPEMPLSIRTTPVKPEPPRPYDDGMDRDGLLIYRYRGTDPLHRDNVGLRLAMKRKAPLVYLFGVVKGLYLPVWPVFVVGDSPKELFFKVAVDDVHALVPDEDQSLLQVAEARRQYVTAVTVRRLHQASFRKRVLRAYRDSCAICRLKHAELLEAAHIIPDRLPHSEPIVPNGLALCKLHHAAFDQHILGIRPDLIIEVRHDILEETDGPMLRYGLQEISGSRIVVPRSSQLRPREEFLEERYEMFREAG